MMHVSFSNRLLIFWEIVIRILKQYFNINSLIMYFLIFLLLVIFLAFKILFTVIIGYLNCGFSGLTPIVRLYQNQMIWPFIPIPMNERCRLTNAMKRFLNDYR